ncbi:DHS-like NAD/FAD-binding domain-containing protein [Catenaria anguillulae PL171]|uniref:Probable electron transfer flavoprotein subunit alpha n=1 Tax=Catenaria anguillulae PL171 TaxID=765915 RepID=A0A1Y2HJJ7_9FUNG|nr:DHS-like NAD/FAD-binding domain-containing protein [Catenaria anguillulae PL171]
MFAATRSVSAAAKLAQAARLASARFNSTLVLVDPSTGALPAGTLNAVSAATQLGHPITFVVPAASQAAAQPLIDNLQPLAPAKILVAANDALAAHPTTPELIAPLVADAAKAAGATHVVGTTSAFAKDVLPRVAALLDVQAVSDVTGVVDKDTFTRPIYAGNAIATVKSKDAIKVLTVRPTAFAPAAPGSPAGAPVEVVAGATAPGAASEFVKEELVKSDRPTLDAAKVVIAGGRALKSADNFKILYDLADKLGGTVGASRAAVDAGYADNSLQIGQTGKVVAPQLYIGCGISGAIQHLAGMKDSKVIVAINKDAEAPIFQVADYGLEADLFEAVPEMTNKL